MSNKDNHFSHGTSRARLSIIEGTKPANETMKLIILVVTLNALSLISRLDTDFSKLNFTEYVATIMFHEVSRYLRTLARDPQE